MADERANTKVGFIGLGSQGAPIARRIIDAGYRVTLWARRPATLEPFGDTSVSIAATIEELGAQCDHVGICVVDDGDTRQVCDALIPAMRTGSRIAIHSTVHPDTCIALEQQAAARGIALIDAPVSGGAPGAEAGTLTVMVGGDAQAFAAARPIFESFGQLILHLGDIGSGQKAKLINNVMLSANIAVAHHAMHTGSALGLEREALVELIKASSGRSFGFEVYARMPTPTAFAHGAALLAKDSRILGEVLGSNASVRTLREVAESLLDLANAKT